LLTGEGEWVKLHRQTAGWKAGNQKKKDSAESGGAWLYFHFPPFPIPSERFGGYRRALSILRTFTGLCRISTTATIVVTSGSIAKNTPK